jgi:hypothetical protein
MKASSDRPVTTSEENEMKSDDDDVKISDGSCDDAIFKGIII